MFTPGQTVIHPHHGPMQVSQLAPRTVRGSRSLYLELDGHANLLVSVPVDQADTVGLRPVMSQAQVDEILEILREPTLPREDSWSRRIKDYQLRLQSGRIDERAVVTREILRSHGLRSKGSAEGSMLRSCLEVLASEISLALSISATEAQDLLVETVGPQDAAGPARSHKRSTSPRSQELVA